MCVHAPIASSALERLTGKAFPLECPFSRFLVEACFLSRNKKKGKRCLREGSKHRSSKTFESASEKKRLPSVDQIS
ncbi:hypothetical protein NDU88_005092 [Pleurodeles waltl]|uniref:Uncharacterized protein n=1 Tax=Pleurodeles waltl TaxID=8319 RepID=A0AAV7PH23_PLEWA|nr:hypothetical protein NDU88_005092 [Pleurodeles waltl]